MRFMFVGSVVHLTEPFDQEVPGSWHPRQDRLAGRQYPPQVHAGIEALKSAAREIGEAFAKAGHTIIVGSDGDDTFDRYVVEGAAKVPDAHVELRCAESSLPADAAPFSDPVFQNIRVRRRVLSTPRHVATFQTLSEMDCLVVAGGIGGTYGAVYMAAALKKPVVAIRAFGGAAAEVWREIRHYYDKAGVNADDTDYLRSWSTESPHATLRIAERLSTHNPLDDRGVWRLFAFMSALIVLLGGWAVLYVNAITPTTALLMAAISALLGTGLRTAMRLSRGNALALSSVTLMMEATVGLLVAFGFVLLYLVGNIAYSGKPLNLNDLASRNALSASSSADGTKATDSQAAERSQETLPGVAVSISLLGLTAGFLLDSAADALRVRLASRLEDKQNQQ